MRRIRTTGIGLVATFAIVGAMAASASAALPEFSNPFPKTFTSTSKASLLETIGGTKLKCASDTGTGEVTAPQSGTIQLTFSKCKVGKVLCNTPGIVPGTIITPLLRMSVGYINKAKKQVGIDLVEAAGLPFLEFICGSGINGVVVGSVIGRVTPVNKVVVPPAVFTLSFTQTLSVQKIMNLESLPVDVLETSFGGPGEQTGFASAEKILFTEPVKLSA